MMPTFYERGGRWRACVSSNGKRTSGTFATLEDAQQWADGIMTRGQRKRHRMKLLQATGAMSMIPPRVAEALQKVPLLPSDILDNAVPLTVCGIYFLIKDQEIVYVGQSRNVFMRIQRHREKGRDFDAFYFQACEANCLNAIEADYIAALVPRWNMSFGNAA